MYSDNKLISYSTMSLVFLTVSEINSQAVYIDLDPDSVVLENELFKLDFDLDGVSEYIFNNYAYASVYDDELGFISARGIFLSGAPSNSLATYTGYNLGTTIYFARALDAGVHVGEEIDFHDHFTRMAYHIEPLEWSFYYAFEGGDWFPEENEKFIGLKFKDDELCTHFGWIRCTVEDNGSILIVHDYAYETKCDVGILAGDTIGDTTTIAVEEINSINANVYSFNKSIFINLNEFTSGVKIHIYDLNGKMIYSDQAVNSSTKIELNEAKGVYFVELINGEKKFRKKVYLN